MSDVPGGVAQHFRDVERKAATSRGVVVFESPKGERVAAPGDFINTMKTLGFVPIRGDYEQREEEYKIHHLVRLRFARQASSPMDVEDIAVFDAALKEFEKTALWTLAVFDNGDNIALHFSGRRPKLDDKGRLMVERPPAANPRERKLLTPLPLKADRHIVVEEERGGIAISPL